MKVKSLANTTLSRRAFLGLGGLAAGGVSLGLILKDTTSDLEYVHHNLPIPNLPKVFSNYRIGFLADFHVSMSIPHEWIESAVNVLIKEKVDLLLLGGDYIAINDSTISRTCAIPRNKLLASLPYDDHPDVVYPLLGKIFGGIKSHVPDGVFGVFGNHDVWVAPELCRRSFAANEISILQNEVKFIERDKQRLEIIGLDEYWNGHPQWPASIPARRIGNEIRVLLVHNPDLLSVIDNKTDFEFQLGLAGHTHGGQISLPLTGPLFYNIRDPNYSVGFYKHPKGSISYTSRGIGVVELPYRINCRPEATIFELIPV